MRLTRTLAVSLVWAGIALVFVPAAIKRRLSWWRWLMIGLTSFYIPLAAITYLPIFVIALATGIPPGNTTLSSLILAGLVAGSVSCAVARLMLAKHPLRPARAG